jgi:transposase
MDSFLSQEQRKELEQVQRSTSNNKKLYVKVTVLLGLDSGHSAESLSSLLGISLSLVYHYHCVYKEKGLTHYLSFHYQGSSSYLTTHQLEALSSELDTRLYPTSQQICEWIYTTFGVYYTPKGLVPLLHRLGFSYKKSKAVPAKADKSEQEIFLKKMLAKLSSLEENEVFLFGDAVHPEWNTRSNYGWIRKGKEFEIKSVSGRKRIHLTGAVNAEEPSTIHIQETQTVNSDTVRAFLDQLEEAYPNKSKIYLVLDQASYFTSYLVQDWTYESKIELIYLPTYSPNLNLIERLWKFMRKKVIDYNYYETFEKFRTNVLAFFQHIEDYIDELETLLVPNFHVQFSKTNFY